MEFVLAVLVLALALVVLAYPLYRVRAQSLAVRGSTLDDLLAQRDGVYATLRDLDLDKQLGKLDDTDYNALREKYMAHATQILQELDVLRGEGSSAQAGNEIEAEVAALRKQAPTKAKKSADSKPVVAAVKGSKPVKAGEDAELFCPNCGRKHNAGDKFCARCGHALS